MPKLLLRLERQGNLVARKKIVFVIVEGPSDDTALGIIFSRIFDKNKVHVEIMHGDITSNFSIAPEKIDHFLTARVKQYAKSMHFQQKDFQQVIHLVDMDGAYISEDLIVENKEAVKPIYTVDGLQTANPQQIKNRNVHKQAKLDKISALNKIWVKIPYQVYYMSCNLDHVLYNKQNSADSEKEEDALVFAKRYKDDMSGFLTFISESEFSVKGSYRESWSFIKQEAHSLNRYSNLGICFEKIFAESKR